MSLTMNTSKGFTIIEVLVALLIVTIVSFSLISMQSSFSKNTTNRTIAMALSDVAQSSMIQCKNEVTPTAEVLYTLPALSTSNSIGKIKVYVTVTGTCVKPVTANTCNDITITTSNTKTNTFNTTKFYLQGTICNFN